MKFFQSFKEKRLRLRLEEYRKNTAAGEWITPLNPDNIQIEFLDLGRHEKSMLYGKKIILNERYESEELFTSLIYELWHLKQRGDNPVSYWIFKMPFFRHKIEDSAEEKEEIAENWLIEKGYVE